MSTSLKVTIVLIIITLAINIFLFSNNDIKRSDIMPPLDAQPTSRNTDAIANTSGNVSEADSKQIITLTAKGGYAPKVTTAKANVPTVIKMVTKGTFDCSSSVSIPKIGYQGTLSSTGETLIDIPAQPKGMVLQGTCSMGMYDFSIKFE